MNVSALRKGMLWNIIQPGREGAQTTAEAVGGAWANAHILHIVLREGPHRTVSKNHAGEHQGFQREIWETQSRGRAELIIKWEFRHHEKIEKVGGGGCQARGLLKFY